MSKVIIEGDNLNVIRIATWNLEKMSGRSARVEACREVMVGQVKAQIWVLTEVHLSFQPIPGYRCVAASDEAQGKSEDFRWVSIWVHESLPENETLTGKLSDPERSARAQISIPGHSNLWAYGTVLPWIGSNWREYTGKGGKAFDAALKTQVEDWKSHEDEGLCVAGDFNQELSPPKHYYGTKTQQKMLEKAFQNANMSCYTGFDADPVAKAYKDEANIDHICLRSPKGQSWNVSKVAAWPKGWNGIRISDHHCVAVEISFPL